MMKFIPIITLLLTINTYAQPTLIVGSITGNQTICAGTYFTQINATPPSNGTNPTYQWQSSPDNSTWANITGETYQNLIPMRINSTTYYRQMQNATGTTGGPLPTNTVTVTTNATSNVRYIQNDTITGSQCYSATDTLTVAGSNTTFVVQSGANVSIVPGWNVYFKPGTKIKSGSHLTVYCIGTRIKKVNEVLTNGILKLNGELFTRINKVNNSQNHHP